MTKKLEDLKFFFTKRENIDLGRAGLSEDIRSSV